SVNSVDLQWWNATDWRPLGPQWSVAGGSEVHWSAWGDSSVLVAVDDTLTVRDLASGRLQGEAMMAAGRIKALYAINDQNVLLMTEPGLQIWDVSTRRAVGRTLNVNPRLNSGFFRSSEMTATRLALKLNSGRTYEAWDVESGRRLFVMSNPNTKQFAGGGP